MSAPPPKLRKIIQQIERETRKRGFLQNQSAIRGLADAVDREYSNRGPADDLARFLLNEGVLIKNGSKNELHFDAERAEVVAQCCENGARTPSPSDPTIRIAELKTPKATQETQTEADEPKSEVPAPMYDEERTHTSVADEVAPSEESIETAAVPQSFPRFIFFLTDAEEDVWTNIQIHRDTEGNIGIPQSEATLARLWMGKKLTCTPAEYHEIVSRFIDMGVLHLADNEGKRYEGMHLYRLSVDPSLCVVQHVDTCRVGMVNDREYDQIRDIQQRFTREALPEMRSMWELFSLMNGLLPLDFLGTWACMNVLGVRPATQEIEIIATMRFEKNPESQAFEPVYREGIFRPLEDGGVYVMSWPGFEEIRFRRQGDMPEKVFEISFGPGDDDVFLDMGDAQTEGWVRFAMRQFFDDEGRLLDPVRAMHLEERPTKSLEAARELMGLLQEKLGGLIAGIDGALAERERVRLEQEAQQRRQVELKQRRSDMELQRQRLEEELARVQRDIENFPK